MTSIHKSKSTWVNEQHECILAANRWALKNIKQPAKKTALHVGRSPFNIPKDNSVLLRDHPEGRHKIQVNHKSKLFVVVLKNKDLMSTQFVHCVGVQCIWSIDDNCLT